MKPLTFAERLRECRQASKLTQKQAADRVGMAQATLSQLESGKYPTSALTPRLAHLYGVHARWLADGVGSRLVGDAPVVDAGEEEASKPWPFTAAREDFERLRPADRRALDKTLTGFIAGTLAAYESAENRVENPPIPANEVKPSRNTMDAVRKSKEAVHDAAHGRSSYGSAGAAKKRSGESR